MENQEKKELKIEDLEKVAGGTMLEWHALNVIFMGADLLEEDNFGFGDLEKIIRTVRERTGYKVFHGDVVDENGEKELNYMAPDGTVLTHNEFMDYLRANYTLEYLSGGIWTD